MAINTFARKEIKFLLNMDQYHGLMEVISQYMNPDKYCIGGKEYGIYNIYYDTPDDYLIRESLSKPYYKEKIRLRSYYSPAAPDDTVFLEIKKKIGGIVTKRRVSMTLAESDAYLRDRSKPECTKYITEQVFRELDAFLDNYPIAPKQYISYQREAFFGKDDGDFRLTFDRKITERRYDLGLNYESYGNYIIGADQRLMEVKVSNAIPDWLVNKLSELEIYKTSFSKYGRAYQNFVKSQVEGAQQASGGRPRIYISGISMVNHNIIMNRSV
ncbi:polyphosphate polymerase domain-containing protein [uncultured Ruminococcus sp.]|uniref:polyphosphate polymerase domain-containing protein n=1 Tax=uncultured Ruminococcus sp. TaxID=165186 RepID=UPI002622DA15|nr:polyphosphate polymerase domain-containing protein [uncultured Ruminococcus sp.]